MRIRAKQNVTCCLNYLLPYQAASQAACVGGTNQAAQLSSRGPRRGLRLACNQSWHCRQDSILENLTVTVWYSETTQKCDHKHPYQHGVEAICRLQLVAVRFCGFTFLFLVILCILNWAVCGKWEQKYSKRITNTCEYSCCIYICYETVMVWSTPLMNPWMKAISLLSQRGLISIMAWSSMLRRW